MLSGRFLVTFFFQSYLLCQKQVHSVVLVIVTGFIFVS